MSPTDTNLHVPPVQAETVVESAPKFERTKTLAKKTFARVGVPVLIGVAAALVTSHKRNNQDPESSDPVIDTPDQ